MDIAKLKKELKMKKGKTKKSDGVVFHMHCRYCDERWRELKKRPVSNKFFLVAKCPKCKKSTE